MDYDVIIIGGGPAGLSAALWCDELGLRALLLEKNNEFGGQLLWTFNSIRNHLGIVAENGRDMRDQFFKQTENRSFAKILSVEVAELHIDKKLVKLKDGRTFSAKSVVIATGVRRRKLNIEGEEKFQNKGILTSGKLDLEKVKGKSVVIVGGGDAAIENALILSDKASKLYLVHRRKELRARREFIDQLKNKRNVEILLDTEVQKILGSDEVESVEIKDCKTNLVSNLQAQAILVRIGVQPNTELFREILDLDENGYIKINEICQTNCEGFYAIGDVSNPISPTVSSAVGSGSTSTKAIRNWLSLSR